MTNPRSIGDSLIYNSDMMSPNILSSKPPGECLTSDNERYVLVLREDGNLVITDTIYKKDLWTSNSSNRGMSPYKLILQFDKNIVIYDAKYKAVWTSDTFEEGSNHKSTYWKLILQDDGNLVLYNSSFKAQWSTDTNDR